jgi:exosortase F-associated protein
MQLTRSKRVAIGLASCAGLLLVYVFQHTDVARFVYTGDQHIVRFVINRSVRFLLNDILALSLIFALFPYRKYLVFAVYVQLAGMILFLFPYFIFKLYFPSYNGPLLNFLHRLILNPTLLILLIPAYYYQRSVGSAEQ